MSYNKKIQNFNFLVYSCQYLHIYDNLFKMHLISFNKIIDKGDKQMCEVIIKKKKNILKYYVLQLIFHNLKLHNLNNLTLLNVL